MKPSSSSIAALFALALIAFVMVAIFTASSDAARRRDAAGCKRVAGKEGWFCDRNIRP